MSAPYPPAPPTPSPTLIEHSGRSGTAPVGPLPHETGLAFTGAPILGLLIVAALLVGVGLLVWMAARRKRPDWGDGPRPIGWDSAEHRQHEIELVGKYVAVHLPSCWCLGTKSAPFNG